MGLWGMMIEQLKKQHTSIIKMVNMTPTSSELLSIGKKAALTICLGSPLCGNRKMVQPFLHRILRQQTSFCNYSCLPWQVCCFALLMHVSKCCQCLDFAFTPGACRKCLTVLHETTVSAWRRLATVRLRKLNNKSRSDMQPKYYLCQSCEMHH